MKLDFNLKQKLAIMIKILCNRIKKKIRKRKIKRKRKSLALKAEAYVYLRKITN
jgi:hypothetical protein